MELGAANYYLVACSAEVKIPRPFANQNATSQAGYFFPENHYVACLFDLEFEHFAQTLAFRIDVGPRL